MLSPHPFQPSERWSRSVSRALEGNPHLKYLERLLVLGGARLATAYRRPRPRPFVVFWKHTKEENIEQIELVVFWKEKKQEHIEVLEFVVFWKQKEQENIAMIEFVVFWVYLACSLTIKEKYL